MISFARKSQHDRAIRRRAGAGYICAVTISVSTPHGEITRWPFVAARESGPPFPRRLGLSGGLLRPRVAWPGVPRRNPPRGVDGEVVAT